MEPAVTPVHHGGRSHGPNGAVTTLVFHDEEYRPSPFSAEDIARYFANPRHGDSCAHYVIDSNSEKHCCPESQVAYHAPPNRGTIGFERDGYASWSLSQWETPAAQMTTCRVAARAGEVLARHGLPARWLEIPQVRAREHGCTSHNNRSKAFGLSTHSDPGPHFPIAEQMALIRTARVWFASPASVADFQRAHGLRPTGVADAVAVDLAAQALYGGGSPSPNAPQPAPEPAVIWRPEGRTGPLALWMMGPRVRTMQAALGAPVDGNFGRNTLAALIGFQRAHGLTPTGRLDDATTHVLFPAPVPVNVRPHKAGPHLVLTGRFDGATVRALQEAIGTKVDGDWGPESKKALQRHLGVRIDGVVGPMTIRALQRRIGATVDDAWGPATTLRLQVVLNGRRF